MENRRQKENSDAAQTRLIIMVGSSWKLSSGSKSKQKNNNEDEEVKVEETTKDELLYLYPGRLWFEDDEVKRKVLEFIRVHYQTFCPNWSKTPPAVRENWWKWFKQQFNYDDETEVKRAFFDKLNPVLGTWSIGHLVVTTIKLAFRGAYLVFSW